MISSLDLYNNSPYTKHMKHAFISMVMIIALVTAAISPACAFLNGDSNFIQICAADGSVKTIAVLNDQSPVQTPRNTHKVQPDCAFCFATAHAKPLMTDVTHLTVHSSSAYMKISTGQIVPVGAVLRSYQSQAPPIV